ncbi:MAG: hypothetical protein V1917_03550 [Candidatus Gottesmanbacteria bacterium]
MKQRILFVCAICLFLFAGMWHTVVAVSDPTSLKNVAVREKIEYALPYPGILPDHPLYIVKRVRDYILERVIMEPVRKGEFYVLQGDKRLNMGVMLIGSGKEQLGESTISKAEKYMEKSVRALLSYQATEAMVPTHIADRLRISLSKHEEVINTVLLTVKEAQKNGLTESLTRVKLLQEEAKKLK